MRIYFNLTRSENMNVYLYGGPSRQEATHSIVQLLATITLKDSKLLATQTSSFFTLTATTDVSLIVPAFKFRDSEATGMRLLTPGCHSGCHSAALHCFAFAKPVSRWSARCITGVNASLTACRLSASGGSLRRNVAEELPLRALRRCVRKI